MIEFLDRWHGQVTGMFTGDECLAGRNPLQGTELCAVVEFMYSLEHLYATFGDPWFADRLERIAFNALPATFSPDMWAHQYDQQVNQVQCTINPEHLFSSNGPESNLYGLEPNFGCCTSNMHQGWPKFVSHLWMATRDEGLVAVAYGPSRVDAKVRGGVAVAIVEDTGYPFRDTVRLAVHPESPVSFPLKLRIPGWASKASIRVNGKQAAGVKPGSFHTVERTWKPGDTVELRFPMPLRAERGYRNSVVIARGPVVFSLKIGEDWKKVKGTEPHADWEVHPNTAWNYALVVDVSKPAKSIRVEEKPVGDAPFSPEGAPVVLTAKARKVIGWRLVAGSAGLLPESPVSSKEPEATVTLIPYGSAKLRVTAFPLIARPSGT
jgi:DUF1680 family protein